MLDIDGVLIDGRPEDGKPWQTGLETDLGIAPDDLQRAFFDPFWSDIETGKADLMTRLEAALAMIGAPVSARAVRDYWYRADSRIVPEVADWLRSVRAAGTEVFLCTNQEAGRAHHVLGALGLGSQVTGIVYSAALGAAKPDPAFFDRARAACLSGTPLLIDDGPENVQAARAAGWQAIHYRQPSDLPALDDPVWRITRR